MCFTRITKQASTQIKKNLILSMYVAVSMHRPAGTLEMSTISYFKRLRLAHPGERCFFGHTKQGPQTWLLSHHNYHLGKLRLDSPHQCLKRWLGRETGSKILRSHTLGDSFLKQKLVTQWSRLGSQYTDNFCGCPGFSLAQILPLFYNLKMDKSVSKHRSHYSAYT